MEAEEARKISTEVLKDKNDLTNVFSAIKSSSKKGHFHIEVNYLNNVQKIELRELGYKVEYLQIDFREWAYKIEWK